MDSFDELGIAPELTEALAAEGIETPTPLQESAIPILGKGNNLVLEAGPGSGLLVAWSVGILERIEAGGDAPRVVVVCPTPEAADRLASSLARLAAATTHTVSALGGGWAVPERADVVFSGVTDLLDSLAANRIPVASLEAVVVDQAQLMEDFVGLDAVERVLDYVPSDAQRVLTALPMTRGVSSMAERLFKRTMTLPSPARDVPQRGRVRFRVAPEPREAAVLRVVDQLLQEGVRHALVYCRSADRAADVGDYLTLHGFVAGAPGDPAVPVWLGIDALEARSAAKDTEGLVVVSCDAPTDPDTLDRRHSIGDQGVVVVLPRELAHLKALGQRTGYETVPFPPPTEANTAVVRLRTTLEAALKDRDTAPYLAALEPLFERYDPTEVAAAAVALLRARAEDSASAKGPEARSQRAGAVPAWAKLFVSVGKRDGLRVGDLLGAITGEAGVSGDAVGKIDLHESHSLVEVHDSVAPEVIQALNGTTIKGRSVRVDFDRPRRSKRRSRGPSGTGS